MRVVQSTIVVKTRGRGLYDVTEPIARAVRSSGIRTGVSHAFVQHTSASLVIQENADPSVRRDLEAWMERIAPEDPHAYEHDAEGPDDMPAHIRASVTRTSETVPIVDGALGLGTWQAIYLWEHRRAGHERRVVITLTGT